MLKELLYVENTREKGEKEGKKKDQQKKNKHKTIKKMLTKTYISIITLNGNALNAPTK